MKLKLRETMPALAGSNNFGEHTLLSLYTLVTPACILLQGQVCNLHAFTLSNVLLGELIWEQKHLFSCQAVADLLFDIDSLTFLMT